MPRVLAPLLAVVACLVCADLASGAVITFGPGRHPDVAIDENNTAHVVWDAQEEGDDRLFYCQIPRTAAGCKNPKTFNPPHEAIGRSTHVFAIGGGRIAIASIRCCGGSEGTHLFVSTDGGLTFAPSRYAGDYERASEVVPGPGNTLLSAGASSVQQSQLSGPTATAFADLDPGFTIPTDGAIGTYQGNTPVFVHSDGDNTSYHVGNSAANLNDPASWTGPIKLGTGGGEVEMEGNPRALVLAQEGGTPGKRTWGTRVFDGSSFTTFNVMTEVGDPIRLGIGGTPFKGGSFHAAWIENGPDLLRWARSPNGFNWSESVAALGDPDDSIHRIRIAGAPDGLAFAVWDSNSPTGSAKGMLLPPKGKGPPIDAVKVAQYEWQFYTPFPCVPAGKSLGMALGVKALKKLPKSKSVNIKKVQFRRAKQIVNDTKPPWKASFKNVQSPVGALRAFIYYRKLTGGPTKVAVLKGSTQICS